MYKTRMLKEWKDLCGRKVLEVKENDASVCLHFKDGFFCVLSGGESYSTSFLSLATDLDDFNHYDLLEMGIITKEKCQAIEDEQQEAVWSKEARDNRRKQYEMLKKEFEPE